jgi:excisionase family DNA binding protein
MAKRAAEGIIRLEATEENIMENLLQVKEDDVLPPALTVKGAM